MVRVNHSSVGTVETWKWGTTYAYAGENGLAGEGFATRFDAIRDFARRSGATFGRPMKYNVHINGHYLNLPC